jgi:hypothetical protein
MVAISGIVTGCCATQLVYTSFKGSYFLPHGLVGAIEIVVISF